MPRRDAQRHTGVELRLAGAARRGIHSPHQLVTAVGGSPVEQRGWRGGVEGERRLKPVLPTGEMIEALRQFGMEGLEAVGLGDMIVLVLGKGRAQGGDELLGT